MLVSGSISDGTVSPYRLYTNDAPLLCSKQLALDSITLNFIFTPHLLLDGHFDALISEQL